MIDPKIYEEALRSNPDFVSQRAAARIVALESEVAELRAALDTERELLASERKEFADLVSFLRGEIPATYAAHVKHIADEILAQQEGYPGISLDFERCKNDLDWARRKIAQLDTEIDRLRSHKCDLPESIKEALKPVGTEE